MKKLLKKLYSWKEVMLMQDKWFETVCESYLHRPTYYEGKELPGFPSEAIQSNTTGQSGIATLKEAFVFYQDCTETFSKLGSPIDPKHHLLEFGVGWGRIARFFLRELPPDHIMGIDVMEEFIQICRDTFRSDNFSVCMPFPPTSIPDKAMNFVIGYSVFSHLSEEACARWMGEFYRVLVPGGIVALTTRGRPFFDQCEGLKGKGHTGYLDALSKLFPDFSHARARYDKGEFVHSNCQGVNGGGAMTSEFYGETFIPESYAKNAYSEMFELEKFLFNPSRQTHPIMFFRKR